MCASMVDIQSPTADSLRLGDEKKKEERKIDGNHRAKIQWPALLHRAGPANLSEVKCLNSEVTR